MLLDTFYMHRRESKESEAGAHRGSFLTEEMSEQVGTFALARRSSMWSPSRQSPPAASPIDAASQPPSR
jgi:hypothetical protein